MDDDGNARPAGLAYNRPPTHDYYIAKVHARPLLYGMDATHEFLDLERQRNGRMNGEASYIKVARAPVP